MFSRPLTALLWIVPITAFSVLVSGLTTYILFEIDPTVVRADVQFVSMVLPAFIAPICTIMILREKFKAQDLARENDRLANTDVLTGLPNRRSFFRSADAFLMSQRTSKSNLVLILCDIDAFKNFNDEYGHETGDQVLVHVARLIGTAAPEDALTARIGGEEFVIMSHVDHETDAKHLAMTLVQTIANSPLVHAQSIHTVTISAGVCYPVNETDLSEVISSADKAMYEAKSTGRNRFVFAA